MTEKKPFDQNTEVIGAVIIGLLKSANKDQFLPILEAHHLRDITPDQWYSLPAWIAALNEIADDGRGMFDLIDASIQVSQNIPKAPSDGTLKGAFLVADQTYQICHRNGYFGELTIQAVQENQITISAYSPYPDDYLYGAFYGHAKNYCPPGKHFTLYRDSPYFYRITWESI